MGHRHDDQARHVLTASHRIDRPADGDGDPGRATFTPGYVDGRGPAGSG